MVDLAAVIVGHCVDSLPVAMAEISITASEKIPVLLSKQSYRRQD